LVFFEKTVRFIAKNKRLFIVVEAHRVPLPAGAGLRGNRDGSTALRLSRLLVFEPMVLISFAQQPKINPAFAG